MATFRERSGKIHAEICVNYMRASRTFSTMEAAEFWADRKEASLAKIENLKITFDSHRVTTGIPLRMLEAMKKANYSEDDILASAFTVETMSGVYFLIREKRVRYVGQTKNLFDRLRRHYNNGKKFDSYAFIPCPVEQLNELEAAYIMSMLPEENYRLA